MVYIEMGWNAFYEKFVSLFVALIVLLFIFLVAVGFLFLHVFTGNIISFFGYAILLCIAGICSLKYYLRVNDFKTRLYLYIPNEPKNTDRNDNPLELEGLEDVSLKACLLYRNCHSLTDVSEASGLKYSEQAKRELIKGLDILLKSYEEHNGNVSLI